VASLICGYAARFGAAADLKAFTEEIAPGAFATALRRSDRVVLLWNHDPSALLASTTSGTLHLREDRNGLYFEATLPDDDLGERIAGLIERGDVVGCSFAFEGPRSEWTERDGRPHRIIRDVGQLWDVSAVTWPAYPATSVTVAGRSRMGTAPSLAALRVGGRRVIGRAWHRTPDGRWLARDVLEGDPEPTLGSERHQLQLARMRQRLELMRRRLPPAAVTS
jgi:HK97 family phage prohead protease